MGVVNSESANFDANLSSLMKDEFEIEDDEDVVEHHRRVERNYKLAELHRYLRIAGGNAGGPGISLGVHGGYEQVAVYDYQTSLRLMNLVQGHIVLFPTRWLQKEVEGSNWFYKADMIPPIQIYN